MRKIEIVHRKNNESSPFLVDVSNHLRNDMSVDVGLFETLLNEFFECRISDLSLGERVRKIDVCRKLVRHYSNDYLSDSLYPELIEEFFGTDLGPTAMFYENVVDMQKSIFLMYQLSYAHYILGKYNKMRDEFPNNCCGRSARNLVAAFWEAGIVSAIMVYDSPDDHAYVLVPFVLESLNSTKGVILVDPTSDQLTKNRKEKIRNNTIIFTEVDWEYRSDWQEGSNLYPSRVELSASYGSEHTNYRRYIEEAFVNPVVVM